MDEHDTGRLTDGRRPAFELTGVMRWSAKAAWVLLIAVALSLLTRGLWDTTYFEPTGDALRTARHGQLIVLVATSLMVAAGGAAHIVLGSPIWVGVLLAAPAVFSAAATTTDALAVLTLVVVYPTSALAVVGVLTT